MFRLLIFPGISDVEDYEDQYDDGDLDHLDSELHVSETEAETNEIVVGRNKRKTSTDLNADADDPLGKKPSKAKKKMSFQEEVLEVQKQQLNFFQESKKRSYEAEIERNRDFFLQLGKIFYVK